MTPGATRYPVQRVEISFAGKPPLRQIERVSGVSEVVIDGQEVTTLSSIRVDGGH